MSLSAPVNTESEDTHLQQLSGHEHAASKEEGQKPEEKAKPDEVKLEEVMQQLPAEIQGIVAAMVRQDPTLAKYLIDVPNQAPAISAAVSAGVEAAKGVEEKGEEKLAGVDPRFEPLAKGAYRFVKSEEVREREHHQRRETEIVDADLDGIAPSSTPPGARPPRKSPPLPPLPSFVQNKNNKA